MRVLGLDVGGTRIKAGIVDPDGRLLDSEIVDTRASEGRDRVLKSMESLINRAIEKHRIRAVGMAVASPMDPERGILYYPPNLPGFGLFDLGSYMRERISVPVVFENDANAYVLGEWWKGAGTGARVLLGITLGTGIGGGLVVDGRVWHGAHGLGAEFGHIVVLPDGPECNCGNRGCFEAVASSRFLMELYERLSGERLTPAGIAERAKRDDAAAVQAFSLLAKNVAIGLASLTNALDPDVVVVGGGLVNAGVVLTKKIEMHFYPLLLPGLRDRVRLEFAKLGDFAAVYGAAYLAIKTVGGDR